MSAIILFDGVCNLCDNLVKFVIKNDKKNYFKFAPLQSESGRELLDKYNIDKESLDSVVLVENDKAYTHSSAALQLTKNLDAPWFLAYPLIFVPKFIRNPIYNWIARNRYKWFGKKDSCMMPTPEIKAKFLG